MTLRQIITKYRLEVDVLHARVHGRIVGESDDGIDDSCMPEWVRWHKAPRVRAAWWSGFCAGGERWLQKRER